MKRFIPYILISLLSLSCTSDSVLFDGSEWKPSLELRYIYMADTDVSIGAGTESFETYVEAQATPWQFSGQASWLTVNPLTGTDATKVTISATENMSGENLRTSLFWLSSAVSDYDYKTMVSVTQQAATPYLNVSESSLTMAATGGSVSINVDRNISYTISKSSSATWLTVEASADSTKLTITVEPNSIVAARSASITLSGLLTQVIYLAQEAAGMISTEYGPLRVGVEGVDFALQITSDAAWTASTSGSWFTVDPAEGAAGVTEVVLSVSPNNTTSTRDGWIDFRIGSYDVLSVLVNQDALYCTVSSTSLSMGANGGRETFTIASNTDWTVISKPSWITTDIVSGSGDDTITITASEHTGREARSGRIKVGIEGVTGLEHSVYVVQSPHYLNLASSLLATLPSTGGTHKVSIASDDIWKAGVNESWLTLSTVAGVEDMDMTIIASDNPSVKRRSGKILITPTYASPIEFPVNQAGRYLSVNTARVVFCWRGGESLPVAVTTDGTFSVVTQCEWLKIERTGNSFTLTAEEYDAEEPRSAMVTVALADLVDGEAYSIDIPVVQRPNVPVDIVTFPQDQNWDVATSPYTTVTIIGYSTDESWYDLGESSLGVNVTVFGEDEDWNQE